MGKKKKKKKKKTGKSKMTWTYQFMQRGWLGAVGAKSRLGLHSNSVGFKPRKVVWRTNSKTAQLYFKLFHRSL